MPVLDSLAGPAAGLSEASAAIGDGSLAKGDRVTVEIDELIVLVFRCAPRVVGALT